MTTLRVTLAIIICVTLIFAVPLWIETLTGEKKEDEL